MAAHRSVSVGRRPPRVHFLLVVFMSLVAAEAFHPRPTLAQGGEDCRFLCTPDLALEPTLSFENIAGRHRVATIRDGQPVDTVRAEGRAGLRDHPLRGDPHVDPEDRPHRGDRSTPTGPIQEPVSIETESLSEAIEGQAYNQHLEATAEAEATPGA